MAKLINNNKQLLIQLEGKFSKILVLFLICLVLGGLISLLGIFLAKPFFGIAFQDVSASFSNLESGSNIQLLKFIQLFNTIGLFVLPGILFVFLFYKTPLNFLKLTNPVRPSSFLLIVLLFFSFLPILNVVAQFNSAMHLPESLGGLEAWMRASEDDAARLTNAFLRMETPTDLFYNILLIGVLPAVGEELIFRGIIQQVINKDAINYHLGIWVSALLFSALHFQFYGFLPRMLLGALFGYLFAWSRNLWMPIFAHFLNNTFALLAVYYIGIEAVEESVDQLGVTQDTYLFAILGSLLFVGLAVYSKRIMESENTIVE